MASVIIKESSNIKLMEVVVDRADLKLGTTKKCFAHIHVQLLFCEELRASGGYLSFSIS